jgi:hypothetical protein
MTGFDFCQWKFTFTYIVMCGVQLKLGGAGFTIGGLNTWMRLGVFGVQCRSSSDTE